jgi:hypothetical protein
MTAGSRAAVVVLTLAYATLAGLAVHDARFLHDEGLLTHLFASLVGREPAAAVFLQKARPPLALLYAPVAGAGLPAFLWAHVLVCALAVPLVAATAHRLGHARPELAAAEGALSPMYVAAGAAGLMNADAVVGVAAVAFFWSSRRWLAAGVVMGALVWVRSELAVLALVLAGAALSERPRSLRALAGLCAFPLVYGLAGAVYHGDLLWMLHWPPALAEPMEDNPFWQAQHGQASLPAVTAALLAITPAVALLGTWRASSAGAVERAGMAFAIVFVAALVLLPRWRVFNFDLSPRYLLPVLPWLALAVSRVSMQLGRDEAALGGLRRGVGLGAFAVLAFAVDRLGGGASALAAGAFAAAAMALGGAGRARLAHAILGALLGLGALAYGDGARIARRQHSPGLEDTIAHLREHPEWDGRRVYTNEPLLAAFVERSSRAAEGMPTLDVRYLVQADQLHELTALANPGNGQRQALLDALRQGFYGTPVLPDELDPKTVPADSIFVLREDPRLPLVMPPERWAPWLRIVHTSAGATIAVLAAVPKPRAAASEPFAVPPLEAPR